MKNFFSLLCLCVFFSITLGAQADATQADYDAILEANFDKDGSGVSAIVAKDGKIIYQGAIGHAR